MAIFNDTFSVYERLASAKMRSLISQINGHTHDGAYGVNIQFSDLDGQISEIQMPGGTGGGSAFITGSMIVDGSIGTTDIAPGAITYNLFNAALQNLYASDGTAKYAYYAP
jgi:hypothetical protein